MEAEGWKPAYIAGANADTATVSYKNHNPGNLRKSIFALGERGGFAYFYNDATGFFALQYDLMMKCLGKTSTPLTPDSTLGELLHVWTAASGDELENYTQLVEARTGISRGVKIGSLVTK